MGSQVRALLFPPLYPFSNPGSVVQLVRTPACHAGGRGFKSLPSRQYSRVSRLYASVAQLVEQRTENPRVVGSIPTGGTKVLTGLSCQARYASVAHLVERHLAKVEVASSSLVTRSNSLEQILLHIWCHSQVVRQSSAKAPFPQFKSGWHLQKRTSSLWTCPSICFIFEGVQSCVPLFIFVLKYYLTYIAI